MGLWDRFLNLIGLSEKPKEPSDTPTQAPGFPSRGDFEALVGEMSSQEPCLTTGPGSIYSGRVEYVGPKFAKLADGFTVAVVFLREMSADYIEQASDVLSEGQRVEFVLVERSTKKPSEWVASIAAVPEARIRQKLVELEEGVVLTGLVADLKDKGAEIDCDGLHVWVPISEIAWNWIDHPSESLRFGESVSVKVLRVQAPEGWLKDKRKRCARVTGSVRACLSKPESPTVSMAMSCLPFKVWGVARTPRSCDPVVSYVLEELHGGTDPANLRTSTGLPDTTIAQIFELMNQEGLAQSTTLTNRGHRLAEAMERARELNADPIRGLFASAAPLASQFLQTDVDSGEEEYPRAWPRPPFDQRLEDEFTRATDEALPELLLQRVAGEEKHELLASLQQDEQLRVFLRRDGFRPWKAVWVPVPEYWVLAGLWSAFEPVGSKEPFHPVGMKERCRKFLLVHLTGTPQGSMRLPEEEHRWIDMYGDVYRRDQEFDLPLSILDPLERARTAYQALQESEPDTPTAISLYFEPTTKTYWQLREKAHIRKRPRRETVFPEFPGLDDLAKSLRYPAFEWTADSWYLVEV